MEQRYRVITGGLKVSADPDRAIAQLTELFKSTSEQAESLFASRWRIAKQDLPLAEARKVSAAFSLSGLRSFIEPTSIAPGPSAQSIFLALFLAPLPPLLAFSVLFSFMSGFPPPFMFVIAAMYVYPFTIFAACILRFIIKQSAWSCMTAGVLLTVPFTFGSWDAFPSAAPFISLGMILPGIAAGWIFWFVGLGPWGKTAFQRTARG